MAAKGDVTAHGMRVFPSNPGSSRAGGNPTIIFLDAGQLSDSQMQRLAEASGHECGFVTAGPVHVVDGPQTRYDVSIRYWVPAHEMEMCGHATIGALWLMERLQMFPEARHVSVSTKAGTFEATLPTSQSSNLSTGVSVFQPRGSAEHLSDSACQGIVDALGISVDDLTGLGDVQNSATSRTKTLVSVKDVRTLDSLRPDQAKVQKLCEAIGSTGLYPYARADDGTFSARQFPKSSGYLEDAATGIAATALVCGLLKRGAVSSGRTDPVRVRQGWAMGSPSELHVTLRRDESAQVVGYWLTGAVESMDMNESEVLKQVLAESTFH